MEIVIATSNNHKIKEYEEMCKGLNISFKSLKDIGFSEEIIEDGKTFEENSLIKAKAILPYTNLPIMADDSGIEIEALGEHFPGVYSHRYSISNGGQEKTNESLTMQVNELTSFENVQKVVKEMGLAYNNNNIIVIDK